MTEVDRRRQPWAWGLLLASMVALGACNTVQGAGQDLEAAGESVSDTAEETEDQL